MSLLPLAALLIVVLRVVVGLNTLGTFSRFCWRWRTRRQG